MNAISNRSLKSVNWSTVVMFALGFWLSSSLIIDTLIIPGLLAAGMMAQDGFASAGYLIFGVFNRVELLCAAVVLTGCFVLRRHHLFTHHQERWAILLSGTLLAVALIYTYILTPQISSLGLNLNLFEASRTMPTAMTSLHEVYWGLEVIKFMAGATLLRWCYHRSCPIA
ncbi:MAG: hypothetical protein ACFB4I_17455 [Cyanophyceae cyanobacterium]